jgi:hypothetical protein
METMRIAALSARTLRAGWQLIRVKVNAGLLHRQDTRRFGPGGLREDWRRLNIFCKLLRCDMALLATERRSS